MAALYLFAQHYGATAKVSPLRWFGCAVGSGFATIGCLAGAAQALLLTRQWGSQHKWIDLAYGPPIAAVAFGFGFALHIGLMGTDYRDSVREWFARLASQMLIVAFAWTAAFSLLVFGPWWLMKFLVWSGGAGGGALIGSWLATTVAGVLSGKSASTTGAQPPKTALGRAKETFAGLVPAIFVAGLMVLLAFGSFLMLAPHASGLDNTPVAVAPRASNMDLMLSTSTPEGTARISVSSRSQPSALALWIIPFERHYWDTISDQRLRMPEFVYLVVVMILLSIGQCRFDINEFSMQRFYSNRLIRCYLGAGRGSRQPSPTTGFDPRDEIRLSDMSPDMPPGKEYLGPQPILNCTVNLTRGEELARLERKGEGFAFTPVACGYGLPEPAYFATKDFMGGAEMGGAQMGLITGISGAAANPNWGYHTTPSVAFLLTFFNVRLGWWVGNPRVADCAARPGPPHSLVPLYNELTSNLGKDANWLNLSDGGHFENLGIYELVRRRCQYIIVGDGEQDENFTFESLGGAVRKCRTDFGVEIDIEPAGIRPPEGKLSATHCVVGTIRYPLLPCERIPLEGKLLYLKASLTGDEPADVLQYRSVHADFPHETTLNQFFTESQFESYRKLGRHVAKSALEVVASKPTNPLFSDIATVFTQLDREWFPMATNVSAEANVGHATEWARLMGLLLKEVRLKSIRPAILAWTEGEKAVTSYDLATDDGLAIHSFYLEIIQLMESVWADLDLNLHARRHGPQFKGWIKVFKRWVDKDSGPFEQAWKLAKTDYTPLFEHFIEQLRAEDFSDL